MGWQERGRMRHGCRRRRRAHVRVMGCNTHTPPKYAHADQGRSHDRACGHDIRRLHFNPSLMAGAGGIKIIRRDLRSQLGSKVTNQPVHGPHALAQA